MNTKKLFLIPFLIVSVLATSTGLFGMEKDQPKADSLESCSEDVIWHIAMFLYTPDFGSLALVSKSMNDVIKNSPAMIFEKLKKDLANNKQNFLKRLAAAKDPMLTGHFVGEGKFITPWDLHCIVSSFARNGDIDGLTALLNNDFICNLIKDRTITTALKNAVFGSHIGIVQAIIGNKIIKKSTLDGCNVIDVLRDAAKGNKTEFVSILLDLNLLPKSYLELMLSEDTTSVDSKELFRQAISRVPKD